MALFGQQIIRNKQGKSDIRACSKKPSRYTDVCGGLGQSSWAWTLGPDCLTLNLTQLYT